MRSDDGQNERRNGELRSEAQADHQTGQQRVEPATRLRDPDREEHAAYNEQRHHAVHGEEVAQLDVNYGQRREQGSQTGDARAEPANADQEYERHRGRVRYRRNGASRDSQVPQVKISDRRKDGLDHPEAV